MDVFYTLAWVLIWIQVSKLRGCELHREVMNIPFNFYYGTCGVFNLGIDVALLCFYYNDWKGCWRQALYFGDGVVEFEPISRNCTSLELL